MNEAEFLERWTSERSMYEAWGQHVVSRVLEGVGTTIAPLAVDIFLRIPPKPRLKTDASILDKAFYRSKPYSDPYAEITDKVGVRFVVLLTGDIRQVEAAIVACPDWACSKDRDFEDEQATDPVKFE